MEHLSLDIKNIKESLSRIEKYILSKGIDGNKANNIKDFEGLSKAAWEFITALYSSQWDSLTVDGTNRSFKNNCYELKSLESDNRITLVLSNTRELDRDLSTN